MAALLLDRGAKVDARDGDGATPLHNAAIGGHAEVAALLLDRGADKEARDGESEATPLYHAAAWGRNAVVELLLKRGANVNARSKAGVTAGRGRREEWVRGDGGDVEEGRRTVDAVVQVRRELRCSWGCKFKRLRSAATIKRAYGGGTI